MSLKNLYVYYDSVTSHVVTRGIPFTPGDFPEGFFPEHILFNDSRLDLGRYDSQTHFKVLRGPEVIRQYFQSVAGRNQAMVNWIDFESIDLLHQLAPNEIAEILYLFHTSRPLHSVFFYKLQNNYAHVNMANGLNKTYYRYVDQFYSRFCRGLADQMVDLVNYSRSFFLPRRKVKPPAPDWVQVLMPVFSRGLKINVTQSFTKGSQYWIPLNIIEDQLTLLSQEQRPQDHMGFIIYDDTPQKWSLDLPHAIEDNSEEHSQ